MKNTQFFRVMLSSLTDATLFFKQKLFFTLVLILLMSGVGGSAWGQIVVSYTAMTSITCPATPVATISPGVSGLIFSQISRGSGVTCGAASGSISGSGFNGNLATNLSNNAFYTFSITSGALTTFSLSSLNIVSRISAATGTPNVSVQYSIGNGAKSVIGSFTPTTSTTTYTITPATSISVGVSEVLNIFIVPNGLTASTTTCRVENNTSATVTEAVVSGVGKSTIAVAAGSEPATISSLINTLGAAPSNFDFTITDDGASGDTDPTLISQIIIHQGSNNHANLLDWTQAISGAELSDGTNTASGTINATNITFASLSNTVGNIGHITDDASKTYNLKIWLKTALGGALPTTIDGKQFDFLVQTSGILIPGPGSSVIAASQSVSSGLSKNVVEVVATKLDFAQNTTTPTGLNSAMTPAVTVSARDFNNNRDLDFTSSIEITSTGTLTGSPVLVAAISGLSTFSTLTHTATGTGLQLTAAFAGLTSAASNLFDVQIASSASDYFRSKTTGNWGSNATWESSPDNGIWYDATLVPDANANTITIQNGHNVTISTPRTADQIVVATGGTLTLIDNFTLANGAGIDLIVNGSFVNTSGTHSFTGTVSFNANSLYQHNRNGTAVPTATWDVTSTLEVIGAISSPPTNITQTLGNFTWNCASQSANIGLSNPPGFTIAGNLTVTSTGGVANRAFRFTSGTAYTLTVGGSLFLNGGHLGLSSGSGTMALTVRGDVTITNSSELYLSQEGSANGTLNIGGNLSVSTGTITESGSTNGHIIVFNGAGLQTFIATSATLSNDINYAINSASSLVLINGLPVNTGRTLTVNGTLDCGSNTLSGSGTLVLGASGILKAGAASGIGTVGLTASAGSTVEFNGTSEQTLTARTFSNLIINNSAGVTLAGNVTITGTLTLISGELICGTYTITSGTISGNTGSIKKTIPSVSNPSNLDLGGLGAILTSSSSLGNVVITRGFTAMSGNGNTGIKRWYNIAPANNSGLNATLVFKYDESELNGIDESKLTLFRSTDGGTTWSYRGGSVDVNANTVTLSGIDAFSIWTLGNFDSPLPVELLSFNARAKGEFVELYWSTASETNNLGFDIERYNSGNEWINIGFVTGAGNSNKLNNYVLTDVQPAKGLNYYRLKQTDFDGKFSYSKTISVSMSGKEGQLIVDQPFINENKLIIPVSSGFAGEVNIDLLDITGKRIHSYVYYIENGTIILLEIENLQQGIYFLNVWNKQNRVVKKFRN